MHGQGTRVNTVREIRIIKDGLVAWSQNVAALDTTIRWRDPESTEQEHYYYLQVVQADGEMAWSSPIWMGPPSK